VRVRFWLTVLVIFALAGPAAALELKGKAALLMDPYSGRIFFAENSTEQLPVASISKLMTLVLALEALAREEVALSDIITASPYAASKRGTRIWLEAGEEFDLETMLFAIAVGSANDACVAVAEFLAGSEEKFVAVMNQRAQELGLSATKYYNSSGLPEENGEENLMSAQDVGVLARHALTVPKLMEFVSTYEYTMRPETTGIPVLWNANRLLRRYYGVDGLKTGFTTKAGYCLAATAKRDQLRLLAVTLGNKDEADRETDARALLDYGFRKYQSVELYGKDAVVGALHCAAGEPMRGDVVLKDDFYVTVERGKEVDLKTVVEIEPGLRPPLSQGTVVGTITAFYGDEQIGAGAIVTGTAVKKAKLSVLIFRLGRLLAQAVF